MKFLKKTITIRIPIVWTLIILLLISGIATCLYLRVPDILYFMLMEPDWVNSGQLRLGSGMTREMTRSEIAEVVEILNDFRFENVLKRRFTPRDTQKNYSFRLNMWGGKTLYIHCGASGLYGIGSNEYINSPALIRLAQLWLNNYFREGRTSQAQEVK